jgi:hypothetical protein
MTQLRTKTEVAEMKERSSGVRETAETADNRMTQNRPTLRLIVGHRNLTPCLAASFMPILRILSDGEALSRKPP